MRFVKLESKKIDFNSNNKHFLKFYLQIQLTDKETDTLIDSNCC